MCRSSTRDTLIQAVHFDNRPKSPDFTFFNYLYQQCPCKMYQNSPSWMVIPLSPLWPLFLAIPSSEFPFSCVCCSLPASQCEASVHFMWRFSAVGRFMCLERRWSWSCNQQKGHLGSTCRSPLCLGSWQSIIGTSV